MNTSEIKNIYKKLPQKIRETLVSPELISIIEEIIKKYNLNKNQQEQIGKVISDILMGIEQKDNLLNLVKNITAIEASKLSSDISKEILEKIDFIYNIINLNSDKEIENANLSEIKEKTSTPSTNIQTFIKNGLWKQGVAKVGKQFNLKEDQISKLENQTLLVLNCTEMPSAFKENIKRELGLDENAGRRIADSINGSVFGQIMMEIKNAWKPSQNSTSNIKIENKIELIDELDPEMMKRAMRPAGEIPNNLPVGPDPYREPLE